MAKELCVEFPDCFNLETCRFPEANWRSRVSGDQGLPRRD
jgi:hypothetical protein